MNTLFLLVPTRRPSHIAAWNTSSTSILLSWKPLADPYFLHGIPRGYLITYNRIDGLESTVQVQVHSSTLSLEVESLDEYVEYQFRVCAFTVKGAGPFYSINCTTDQDAPGAPPQHVFGYNISKHDIQVLWEEVPFRDVNGILLGYMVFFNESSDEVFNETVPFPRKNVTLSFLRPYTFYTIQVLAFTIKGNGPKSPPIIVRTEEEAPQVYPWNVTGYNTTSRSIHLQWSAIPQELVAGVLREYRVVYVELNDLNYPVKTHVLRMPIDQLSVNLTNLEKYTNYSFQIQGISKFFGVNSPPIIIITDQDVPSHPPLNIISTNTSSTSLLITWEHIPKKLIHGILLGYRVFYHQRANEYYGGRRNRRSVETINETIRTLPPNATSLRIFNLKKFTYYSFQVVGFTSKGDGQISLTYNVSTDEDIPSKPPMGPSAVNLSGPHSILVSWKPVPEGFVHGILLGYRILYRVLSIAEVNVRQPTVTATAKPTALNITLTQLLNYAVYDIRVLAFTVKGDGMDTRSIIAETCRCPLQMTTNWHSLPPYMKSVKVSNKGTIPFILNWATHTCCLPCANGHGSSSVDYEHDRGGVTAEKDNVSSVHKIEYESDFSFPIEGYRGQSTFGVYRYVPLMESPGVAFVAPVPSLDERASFVIWVTTACFPMFLLSLLMMVLAASVIWVLESTANPEEFPSSFTGGLWEGFWWSFITCTTLGYGDKIPRTFLGRLFGIAWTLFGLVMMWFLVADMTNALISYSMLQTTNRKVYGARVGAIQGSPEYLLGLRKVANMNPVQQYHTYYAINKALKDKEIDGALIDVYVLSMQKHLSSNRNLRVIKVFDYKKTYGVVLAGPSMKLEKCFLDFVKFNKREIYHRIQETIWLPRPQEESVAEEMSGGLFDTNSSQFSFSYLFLTSVLGFALLCGLVGQIYCKKVKQHSNIIGPDKHFASLRQELSQEVNTFYLRVSKIANELRRAHIKEKRQLLERRRRKSFFQITLTSVRKLPPTNDID
ncbi:Receptor-type tyrosine-protein phosphatase F [Stylophora pistillata]|uniref:Receptor-type tyrosine-protein phosphatase F n=1 Tax=Stylophora pistillata TaxID=50429 RepID=A0A2B4RLR9_STYPI|nr:Receptor-type tyrosine-protein phosphatase F [Stylophora pistillata]